MNTEPQHIETSGSVLKRKLGLENFRHVRIARVLGTTKRVFYVFYNSYRPMKVLSKMDITKVPQTAAIFMGDIMQDNEHRPLEYYPITAPIYIEQFNGNISSNTFIIAIDLSGSQYVRKEFFSRRFKESTNKIQETVRVYEVEKLEEGITLYDLVKNAGLSDFTKYYASERGRVMGSETKASKLIDCSVNEKEGWVEFYFLSEATEKYDSKHLYKEVDPLNNFALKKDPSKLYTITIRIMDFLDWLKAAGETIGSQLVAKDIKEVLEIADVKLFSTSPSFQYQGMNWSCSSLDASVYPTDIAPTVWNTRKNRHNGSIHGGNQILDKHLQRVINQIPFFANPMASMLTKKLHDLDLI